MSDHTNNENGSEPDKLSSLAIDSERLREMVIDLELSKERAKELRVLSDSLLEGVKALTSSNKTEEIFSNLIASLSNVLECDAAIVLNKIDAQEETQVSYLEVTFSSSDFVKIGDHWEFGSTFERATKGKPLILADISKLPEWQDKAQGLKEAAQSTLYLPVMGNRNTAILVFISREKSYYTNKHRALAAKLIPLVQQAIINSEFTEQIEESLSIVRGKNKQIETILNNINEGVFVIKSNRTIGNECSPAFNNLLNQAQCVPKFYSDVLKCLMKNLSDDQLDIVLTTMNASLGEDAFQWDMNAHNLPTESQFENAQGKPRLLEWDWSPIEDESGMINEVLVSIRDVTELRHLQIESAKEKELFDIIYNIVAAGTDKASKFIDSSRQFINENRKYIQSMKNMDMEIIKLLFRNMHTIKGSSRTLKFNSISNISHTIESYYDELRHQKASFDCQRMLCELDELDNEIEKYSVILRDRLGKIGSQDTHAERDHLCDTLMTILQTNEEGALEKIKKVLLDTQTICLDEVLEHHINGLSDMAIRLGKAVPIVEINDHGIRLKKNFANALSEAMTHCFRNAIDHGIENIKTRKLAGKPERGTIVIQIIKEPDNRYTLLFWDDGAGLNLTLLAEKLDKKNPTDEEIAETIFQSGISTCDRVTDISGRGVGMDALKGFMQKFGAETRIQFIAKKLKSGRRPFQIAISLPAESVVAL